MMTTNQKPAAPKAVSLASVALPALWRLSLLVAPMTVAVMAFSHSPIFCALICLAILSLWLTVDAGPFRAASAQSANSSGISIPSARQLTRMQWWNGLFCRAIIVSAVFYSKLNV